VAFLNGVAQQRCDPMEFPGLAAMIPASPLVQWLNRPGGSIPGALYVVAGDLEGESVGSWLKTLAADAFYWTDNDIVVQTRSMYGGAPRAQAAAFVLDQGGKSTHFNYFSNRVAVDAVVSGLTQRDPDGYRPIGPMSWAGESSTGTRAKTTRSSESHRPAVFVLPGILGSNLRVGDKRIWLGLGLLGGLDELRYQPEGADEVSPDGAIGLVYNALIRHLQGEHEVVEFSFDWRRPIEEEARRLGAEVQAALDARRESGQPVRLLVHSMGGVVARTMQLECPAIWQRLMSHPQARLVMLGTPNGGSWAPMQVLSGDDTFGNALAAVGAPFQDQAARQLMAGMPGFIQLQAGLTDPKLALDQEETWRNLARRDLARCANAAGGTATGWARPTVTTSWPSTNGACRRKPCWTRRARCASAGRAAPQCAGRPLPTRCCWWWAVPSSRPMVLSGAKTKGLSTSTRSTAATAACRCKTPCCPACAPGRWIPNTAACPAPSPPSTPSTNCWSAARPTACRAWPARAVHPEPACPWNSSTKPAGHHAAARPPRPPAPKARSSMCAASTCPPPRAPGRARRCTWPWSTATWPSTATRSSWATTNRWRSPARKTWWTS
jgi:hypothetical protein